MTLCLNSFTPFFHLRKGQVRGDRAGDSEPETDERKKETWHFIISHSIHRMEQIQEDIEESLDDLLIFPTKEGLRVTTRMITSYFQLEVETMKQYNGTKISDQQYESIVSVKKLS